MKKEIEFFVFLIILSFQFLSCTRIEDDVLIKKIDHLMIEVKSDKDAHQLLSLLSDTLKLPISFALINRGKNYSKNYYFYNGLVHAGNLNIEVINFNSKSKELTKTKKAQFKGFAFEPLNFTISALENRTLTYSLYPFHYSDSVTSNELHWTNVFPHRIHDQMIFICNFSAAFFKRSYLNAEISYDFKNNSQLHEYFRNELLKRNGGPLGIISVKEIVLGVRKMDEHMTNWRKLLKPHNELESGYWNIGTGPALHFIPDSLDLIKTLIFEVSSLTNAKNYLQSEELLDKIIDDTIYLNKKRFWGLDIRLVE